MRSWGGENIDQSLRTWLCGGEIVYAEGSRVAPLVRSASGCPGMWRKPQKEIGQSVERGREGAQHIVSRCRII